MSDREIVSKLVVEIGQLKESDIEPLEPILVQHVRDRRTREILTDERERSI